MPYTAPLTLSCTARARLCCISLIAAWIYVAWADLFSMVQAYSATSFNYHGFLILPLVLLLIRQQSTSSNRIGISFSIIGLILLLCSGLLWLTAKISDLPTLAQIATISMLITIILTSYGPKITTKLALPLVSLFLLLPVGAELYNYTQIFFSHTLVKILALFKLSVYWDHQSINVNGLDYSLSALCAALNYATLYIALSLFYATFVCKKLLMKILVIVSSITLPVILNIFAFAGVIAVNSWYGLGVIPNNAIIFTSWSAVAAGILFSLAIGMLWRSKKRVALKGDGIDWRTNLNTNKPIWLPATIATVVILCMLPFSIQSLKNKIHFNQNWLHTATLPTFSDNKIALAITYDTIDTAHVGYDSKVWHKLKTTNRKIKIGKKSIPVQETLLKKNQHTKIIWNLHYTNGHYTANTTLTKILENYYALSHQGAKIANINLSTDVNSNIEIGRERLQQAVNELQAVTKKNWK